MRIFCFKRTQKKKIKKEKISNIFSNCQRQLFFLGLNANSTDFD